MLLSQEELAQSAIADPEVAQFYKDKPLPDINNADYKAIRKIMQMVAEQTSKSVPEDVSELYHDIPMRDGFMSSLKVHKPKRGPPGPLIVLAFGGAFMAGTNEQLSKTARALVRSFGATVVNISYRLSPEYPFPTAQQDGWDSMIWLALHASDELLSANTSKGFIMGGVSAGGSMTAALSRQFQSHPLAQPLTGQWLAMPSCVGPKNVPEEYKPYWKAYEQTENAPALTPAFLRYGLELSKADETHPLRYAIRADTPVAGQPKTYFQVDGMDPLRDDGLIYHEVLSKGGVETKMDFYPGCPHVHFSSVPGTKLAEKGNVDTLVGMGWLLGQEISRERAAEILREGESNDEMSRPL